MWDTIKWFMENIVQILTAVSIIAAMVQTWRATRKDFWTKIKEIAEELINTAEAMPEFKAGEGPLKSQWVIEQLLKEFSGKFAFINEKKLQKIIDKILKGYNIFSKLN